MNVDALPIAILIAVFAFVPLVFFRQLNEFSRRFQGTPKEGEEVPRWVTIIPLVLGLGLAFFVLFYDF